MPQVTAEGWVPVEPDVAFAVSQTTGEVRMRWDPFIREQHLIDADVPAKGVRTHTRARVGPRMVSEYVSYRPPTSVGMTMVTGPWFFASFGGGWRFVPAEKDGRAGTRAVWKYTYSVRPSWLRFVAEPIGQWLLGREIRARIAAWARACEDPVVLDSL
ncbi:SRPBCC family protein [Aeromicrobium duanguangcaii]|uniref:SRPBCC family protein n=1 Tax=Aeromicrobium duanguangcaii TaxID=2968086 RepID=UPI002017C89E|nr:SRPBCC family protein [Aeromicrobium duanguangcaii]MCL3836477.1 SRPBCC family protein [Aeromicrobium duanguangcaii]